MHFAVSWSVLKSVQVKISTSSMVELASVWFNKYTQSSADYFCIIHYYAFTAGSNHNQRYFTYRFCVLHCFVHVVFTHTDKTLRGKQDKLSHTQVNIWLQKHPKSPWWINNYSLAKYCGIQSEEDAHKTTVFDKFVPRKQSCWQSCVGMCLWIKTKTTVYDWTGSPTPYYEWSVT